MWVEFFRDLHVERAWALVARVLVTAVVLVALLLLLSGCSTIDTATRAQTRAAEAAEFTLCRGISIGEWRRRYGTNPTKASAWAVLCADGPVLPPPEEAPNG